MVSAGDDDDFSFFDFVNQAIRAVDPPRPKTREIVFERLGFPDSGERIFRDVERQFFDFAVLR